MSLLSMAAALACGVLLGEKRFPEASLVASAYVIYAAQDGEEYERLQRNMLGAYRPKVAETPPMTAADPTYSAHRPAQGGAIAVAADLSGVSTLHPEATPLSEPAEPAYEAAELPVDEAEAIAPASYDPEEQVIQQTGMSLTAHDHAFASLPRRRHVPVVATAIDDDDDRDDAPPRPAFSAQNMEETQARDSFYSTLASGGDVQPRGPPGEQWLRYLSAVHG